MGKVIIFLFSLLQIFVGYFFSGPNKMLNHHTVFSDSNSKNEKQHDSIEGLFTCGSIQ